MTSAPPILCRVHRGDHVESVHRGSWALVDGFGSILEGAGDMHREIFARSAVKALQALPLIESGAAEAAHYDVADLALALASHSGESRHTERVAAILERLGHDESALDCGPQPPTDPRTRKALTSDGERPSALHNNCSGKHAGFLALAKHLGADPARYLDPTEPVQSAVRVAVGEMTGLEPDALQYATDGCSAPTWRLPLAAMGRAFARLSTSKEEEAARRSACDRITAAAAAHPDLIAGTHGRLCTEILEASEGALFPKVGAEAVYVVGVRGRDMALVAKIDDGAYRAVHALVVHLLRKFDLVTGEAYDRLAHWENAPLKNWAGREVGRLEVCP